MAISWPIVGQRHFGARASRGHNLAIFRPILTYNYTKINISSIQIEWNKKLSYISFFYILVLGLTCEQCCTYGLKTTLKLLLHVRAIMANSYLKNQKMKRFSKKMLKIYNFACVHQYHAQTQP